MMTNAPLPDNPADSTGPPGSLPPAVQGSEESSRKALEAALAGTAGMLLGRAVMGRFGGVLGGLAGLGLSLMRKPQAAQEAAVELLVPEVPEVPVGVPSFESSELESQSNTDPRPAPMPVMPVMPVTPVMPEEKEADENNLPPVLTEEWWAAPEQTAADAADEGLAPAAAESAVPHHTLPQVADAASVFHFNRGSTGPVPVALAEPEVVFHPSQAAVEPAVVPTMERLVEMDEALPEPAPALAAVAVDVPDIWPVHSAPEQPSIPAELEQGQGIAGLGALGLAGGTVAALGTAESITAPVPAVEAAGIPESKEGVDQALFAEAAHREAPSAVADPAHDFLPFEWSEFAEVPVSEGTVRPSVNMPDLASPVVLTAADIAGEVPVFMEHSEFRERRPTGRTAPVAFVIPAPPGSATVPVPTVATAPVPAPATAPVPRAATAPVPAPAPAPVPRAATAPVPAPAPAPVPRAATAPVPAPAPAPVPRAATAPVPAPATAPVPRAATAPVPAPAPALVVPATAALPRLRTAPVPLESLFSTDMDITPLPVPVVVPEARLTPPDQVFTGATASVPAALHSPASEPAVTVEAGPAVDPGVAAAGLFGIADSFLHQPMQPALEEKSESAVAPHLPLLSTATASVPTATAPVPTATTPVPELPSAITHAPLTASEFPMEFLADTLPPELTPATSSFILSAEEAAVARLPRTGPVQPVDLPEAPEPMGFHPFPADPVPADHERIPAAPADEAIESPVYAAAEVVPLSGASWPAHTSTAPEIASPFLEPVGIASPVPVPPIAPSPAAASSPFLPAESLPGAVGAMEFAPSVPQIPQEVPPFMVWQQPQPASVAAPFPTQSLPPGDTIMEFPQPLPAPEEIWKAAAEELPAIRQAAFPALPAFPVQALQGAEPRAAEAEAFLPTIRLSMDKHRAAVSRPPAAGPFETPSRPVLKTVPLDPVVAAPSPPRLPEPVAPIYNPFAPAAPSAPLATPAPPDTATPKPGAPLFTKPDTAPQTAADPAPVLLESRNFRRPAAPAESAPRRLFTPLRVLLLLLLLAGSATAYFRHELKDWFYTQVLGKSSKLRSPSSRSTAPSVPLTAPEPAATEPVPGALEPAVPAPPITPPPPPAEPAPVPPSVEASVPVAPPAPVPVAAPTPAAAAPATGEAGARLFAKRLCAATDAGDVLPHIYDEQKLTPAVTTYYKEAKGTVLKDAKMLLDTTRVRPGAGFPTHIYQASSTEHLFPVSIDEVTPGHYQIDWELFTQCKDRALEKWAADPSSKPATFCAVIQRAYGFGLPNRDQNLFFSIKPPNPTPVFNLDAAIPKNTPVANTAATMGWENYAEFHPVVELTHRGKFVEITAIVRPSWLKGVIKRAADPAAAAPRPSAGTTPAPGKKPSARN